MMLLVAVWEEAAFACVPPNPSSTLTINVTLPDDVAPPSPVLVEWEVHRGGWVDLDGTLVYNTCSWGTMTFVVERPEGDPDDEHTVGYRFRDFVGTLPPTFDVPVPDHDPILGPNVRLTWGEQPPEALEPFAFTASMVPVDVAGNEGEAIEIHVEDDGYVAPAEADSSGCTTAATGAHGTFSPAGGVVFALWLTRRRKIPRERR
jgi:hypothetical protein